MIMEKINIIDLAIEKAKIEKKVLISELHTIGNFHNLKNAYSDVFIVELKNIDTFFEILYNLCKDNINKRCYKNSNNNISQISENTFEIYFENEIIIQNFSEIKINVDDIVNYFNNKIINGQK